MDAARFDTLTRRLTKPGLSRQAAVRLAAGGFAAALARLGRTDAAARRGQPNARCERNRDCSAGLSCRCRRCRCGGGLTNCSGVCSDLNPIPFSCGVCGNFGPFGHDCCNGACVEIARNPSHCGACGNVCLHHEVCNAGRCVCDDRSGLCPPGSAARSVAAAARTGAARARACLTNRSVPC